MFKVINKSKGVGIKRDVKSHIFSPSSVRLSVAASSLNLLTTEYSGEQKEGCAEKSLQRNLLICRHENLLSQTVCFFGIGSSSTLLLVNLHSIISGVEPKFHRSYSFFGSSENWSDQVFTSHHSTLNISCWLLVFFSPPALQNSQLYSSVTLWKQTLPLFKDNWQTFVPQVLENLWVCSRWQQVLVDNLSVLLPD